MLGCDKQADGKEMHRQLRNVVLEEDATNPLDDQEGKQVYHRRSQSVLPTTISTQKMWFFGAHHAYRLKTSKTDRKVRKVPGLSLH